MRRRSPKRTARKTPTRSRSEAPPMSKSDKQSENPHVRRMRYFRASDAEWRRWVRWASRLKRPLSALIRETLDKKAKETR